MDAHPDAGVAWTPKANVFIEKEPTHTILNIALEFNVGVIKEISIG